jgi:hypothetical protein
MHDTLARELVDYIQIEAGIFATLRLGGKHWIVCWQSRNGKDHEHAVALCDDFLAVRGLDRTRFGLAVAP